MTPGQHRLEEFGPPGSDPDAGAALRPSRIWPPGLPGVWKVEGGFVEHPLLAPRTIRALPFQLDLARVGLRDALLAAELLREGRGKVLLLAPTRPLVQQHADALARWIPDVRRARFTGTVKRPVREGGFESAELVCSTPEVVANDLATGRYDLKEIGLLVLDEAHHAVGRYAYVPIAARFRTERPVGARLLGLTASPGGQEERIEEVVAALGVHRIEARSREDEGVREHVQEVQFETVWVDLSPTARAIRTLLQQAHREEGHALQKMGFLRKKPLTSLSIKDLLAVRSEIFARPGPMTRKFGPLFRAGVLLHLHHALERLETQGIVPFTQYAERVRAKEKLGRADRAFLARSELIEGLRIAADHRELTQEASHPKLDALTRVIEEELARPRDHPPRILVFAQYRDTIQGIQQRLETQGWEIGRFVGQATRDSEDPGMSQKDQTRVLDGFRQGRFPVLVASSVAEEGLDVPDVDLVVFFESVPSEIRAIQRRGRTGRSSLGRVVLLLTRETRDVGYQQAEARREQAMGRIVRKLSAEGRRRRKEELAAEVSPTLPKP
jgi:ERCC4-related helicase